MPVLFFFAPFPTATAVGMVIATWGCKTKFMNGCRATIFAANLSATARSASSVKFFCPKTAQNRAMIDSGLPRFCWNTSRNASVPFNDTCLPINMSNSSTCNVRQGSMLPVNSAAVASNKHIPWSKYAEGGRAGSTASRMTTSDSKRMFSKFGTFVRLLPPPWLVASSQMVRPSREMVCIRALSAASWAWESPGASSAPRVYDT
mmetsp:Transcript_70571/g.216223  ORF Transcript_70571/g.216223 Transcript_70571/m.216223 type:complete len:204 (+) Transcript_70571:140-751(+)